MVDLNVPKDDRRWWRDAVIYQVYVRSFADSDGDGVGDLAGITARLPHLQALGVDALWITPFYTSPQHDHGYDVADYCDVDPLFGDLAAADAMIARAHELGLRVIVDLVPNHSSSEHPWFQAALAAEPGSAERARYLFRPGKGRGRNPAQQLASVFGGPAWTRIEGTDQWYLHLFDSSQPDFDWRNPEVGDLFEDILRFWLDRGVDGFRVDVAHGLFKEESLRDQRSPTPARPVMRRRWSSASSPTSRCGTSPRCTTSTGAGPRCLTSTARTAWRWLRPGPSPRSRWPASSVPTSSTRPSTSPGCSPRGRPPPSPRSSSDTLEAAASVDAAPTWVLSNHDVTRHVTRYGGGTAGLARAKAATLTMLALPGASYLYAGEELGLEEVDVPPEARQDPTWHRGGGKFRDGCRVPLPWEGSQPPYAFGPGAGQPWLPQPLDWEELTVAAQEDQPGSTLEFYRAALAARRTVLKGSPPDVGVLSPPSLGDDVLAFVRGDVTVVLNAGSTAVPLPPGEVVIASGPVSDELPADTAVWLR
jgi:alpha-glucosidase